MIESRRTSNFILLALSGALQNNFELGNGSTANEFTFYARDNNRKINYKKHVNGY